MLQELTGMVRTRTVSARELIERALTRVERHNGALNAVIALRAEESVTTAP
jgi:Asp-tRNA(Asn)/Glu-tRNA(Gln) amidotransferase A subunit family amidase